MLSPMHLDLTSLTPVQVYATLTQTIMPRPIAWILTENPAGDYNLAPFSYFNAIGSTPAMAMVSITPQPDGSEKDTLQNLRARESLVVHIATCDQLDALNQTSATLPAGVSEVEAGGLALTEQADFPLPRLLDCMIAFNGRAARFIDIGTAGQVMVLMELAQVYLADECVGEDAKGRLKIKAEAVRPLARLGASEYALFGEVARRERPA